MSSLMSYLRNWGDSLTYSDKNSRTEITAENIEGNYYRFTMPFEGIVMLEGRAGADGSFFCHLWGDDDPITTGIDSNSGSPFGVRCIGRFHKGQFVRYVLSGFNEMHVYAYKLTGGGDNWLIKVLRKIVKEGTLCLNSLTKFAHFLSSVTRSACQKQTPVPSLLKSQVAKIICSLVRLMDMCALTTIKLMAQQKSPGQYFWGIIKTGAQQRANLSARMLTMVGLVLGSVLGKEISATYGLATMAQMKARLGSFLMKGCNPVMGGVL